MTRCTISDNVSAYGGGGMVINGPATLNECVISDNDGSESFPGGGIAYLIHGPLTLTDCQVTGNTSANGGGIDVACQGTPLELDLNGGSVENNTAVNDGKDISNCGKLHHNARAMIGPCLNATDGKTTGCGCPEGTPCS